MDGKCFEQFWILQSSTVIWLAKERDRNSSAVDLYLKCQSSGIADIEDNLFLYSVISSQSCITAWIEVSVLRALTSLPSVSVNVCRVSGIQMRQAGLAPLYIFLQS